MNSQYKVACLSFCVLSGIANCTKATESVSRFVHAGVFRAPEPRVGAFFGQQVEVVNESVIAITARNDSTIVNRGGAVHMFDHSNGTHLSTIFSPNPEDNGLFGHTLLAVGVQLLIGAEMEDDNAGRVYLFDADGTLHTTFEPPEPSIGAELGWRGLASDGESVFISSSGFDDSGAVFRFDFDGKLLATYRNPTQNEAECFGRSLNLLGNDRLIVGDCDTLDGELQAGAAHMFQISGEFIRTFENPDPAALDLFATSVVAGHDRVLIGGLQIDHETTGLSSGAAYLFRPDGSVISRVDDPNPADGNWFGRDADVVNIGGEELFIVGSIFHSDDYDQNGSAFLIDADGAIVQQFLSPEPGPGQQFGIDFAQVGDQILIGETQFGGSPNFGGAVWVFAPAERYDVNLDGATDVDDISLLCTELAFPSQEADLPWLDISGDSELSFADIESLLVGIGTSPGDTDANQTVDFSDFLQLSTNFGEPGNWSNGDFDCNGHVEFDDFLVLSDNFGFDGAANAVPEPSSGLLMLFALPLLLRMQSIRRRTPNRT